MGIKTDPKKPGTFVVSYAKRHPITKQSVNLRRKGIESKAEARRVYNELVIAVNDKIKRAIIPTWEALLEKYFQNCLLRGISDKTVSSLDQCLRAYTLKTWGHRMIDSITPQEIRDLILTRLDGKAQSYRQYILKGIRAVFSFAVESGLLLKNPSPVIRFKVEDKIRPGLSEKQVVTLLKKAQELNWEWYPHYAVAVYTGLRSGEMYALTWSNVDLEKRTILVNCSWSNKTGIKSTKSGDHRIVEIPRPLVPLLKELKVEYGNESDFVLPRNDKWDRGQQARELRIFLQLIGLPRIRFHDLRATWATLLLGRGVEPSKVMSMGGWKDMETMMIYMRKAGIDIRGATDCLDHLKTHGIQEAKVLNLKG